MSKRPHLALRPLTRVQHGDVRAIHLVPREGVDVDVEGPDVDGPVRRPRDSIYDYEGIGGRTRTHGSRNLGDRVGAAEDVARVRARYQTRARCEERSEGSCSENRVWVRRRRRGSGRPPLEGQLVAGCEVNPRPDVCLVIDARDDYLVALRKCQCKGDVVEQLCRGGAEHFWGPAVLVYGVFIEGLGRGEEEGEMHRFLQDLRLGRVRQGEEGG